MKLLIEEYKPRDLPQMIAIWNDVVQAGAAFPQERSETLASGQEFFAAQSYCGVAKDAETGAISGLYILHPNNIGRCGHICNASYAVAIEARGRGIGKSMVLHSLEQGRRLGFRILQFNAVAADNLRANRLYQSLGFVSLGSIPAGFRRDDGSYVDINLYYHPL